MNENDDFEAYKQAQNSRENDDEGMADRVENGSDNYGSENDGYGNEKDS